MKKIRVLISCGSGIATSTVIANRVKEVCESNGYPVSIDQVKIVEVEKRASEFDLIVSSAQVPSSVKTPSVIAINYLTGINKEQTDQKILDILASL
ncbi:PTS sugar transporter subunit IIB [Neobacillus mesonae]|uniref:PTS sugar transporter subunit IIB n=1 Tax=Neobacillus mesonae TaxID=1193713 RepID=UPI00203ED542|nr:PTS sugar transporter subunit IIB [Neobacillus mesonae]MCM3568983.1 PTS sugar transporter subunit IIB [Neobacillus mesonae]